MRAHTHTIWKYWTTSIIIIIIIIVCVCPFIRQSTAWVSNLFKAKGQNHYGGMIHGPRGKENN